MATLKHTFNKDLVDKYTEALIIGTNVFNLRKKIGITQSELAILAGTTQRIISDIEAGDYSDSIGVGLLAKIANALNVKLYILNKKIDWISNELIYLILKKSDKYFNKNKIDILGMMKLFFFIDYESKKYYGETIRNCKYIRYYAGPYDSNLYKSLKDTDNAIFYNMCEDVDNNFSEYTEFALNNKSISNFTLLSNEQIEFINKVLDDYLGYSSMELRDLSYQIEEMKDINATIGGVEGLYSIILQ